MGRIAEREHVANRLGHRAADRGLREEGGRVLPGQNDHGGTARGRQRGNEQQRGTEQRIMPDNCPQCIARYFKEFIRVSGMTHVRTSPCYPQSNGKIERWHKSLKSECIRPGTPLSLEDARRLIEGYVEHYNNVRLNSATCYITPKDMLAGRQQELHRERDRKLEAKAPQRPKADPAKAGEIGAPSPGVGSTVGAGATKCGASLSPVTSASTRR